MSADTCEEEEEGTCTSLNLVVVGVGEKGTSIRSWYVPPLLGCVFWPQPGAASVPEAPAMTPAGVDFSFLFFSIIFLGGEW